MRSFVLNCSVSDLAEVRNGVELHVRPWLTLLSVSVNMLRSSPARLNNMSIVGHHVRRRWVIILYKAFYLRNMNTIFVISEYFKITLYLSKFSLKPRTQVSRDVKWKFSHFKTCKNTFFLLRFSEAIFWYKQLLKIKSRSSVDLKVIWIDDLKKILIDDLLKSSKRFWEETL